LLVGSTSDVEVPLAAAIYFFEEFRRGQNFGCVIPKFWLIGRCPRLNRARWGLLRIHNYPLSSGLGGWCEPATTPVWVPRELLPGCLRSLLKCGATVPEDLARTSSEDEADANPANPSVSRSPRALADPAGPSTGRSMGCRWRGTSLAAIRDMSEFVGRIGVFSQMA
jgi:hypothetical protein